MSDKSAVSPGTIAQLQADWDRARAHVRRCAANARASEARWQRAIEYEVSVHQQMRTLGVTPNLDNEP